MTDDARRAANRETIRYFFTHMAEVRDGGLDEVAKYRPKDTAMALPFAGLTEPMTETDHGMAGMQTVPNTFQFWRWEIVRIFDGLDPDVFWVEADAVARTRTLDLDYRQRYVNEIRFEDGKISFMKEYFDTDQVALLMQELEHQQRAASGSPAVDHGAQVRGVT